MLFRSCNYLSPILDARPGRPIAPSLSLTAHRSGNNARPREGPVSLPGKWTTPGCVRIHAKFSPAWQRGFLFLNTAAVLDFLRGRSMAARLPMRGTSGSVRRSPANPARPGREQRYRDHFVRRGVPEVPLICSAQACSSGAGRTYSRPVRWSVKL